MDTPLSQRLKPSDFFRLPAHLFQESSTIPLEQPRLSLINHSLLKQLSLNSETFINPQNLELLSGKLDALRHPAMATIYAGHQFGIYTSKLGDGRVHIIGDVTARNGETWEIQLKGAGPTAFARGNTGRMTLSEAITEYLGSCAIAGLGIDTSHGLALITEPGVSPHCIFVRAARSHIRFGHFEYCHNQQDFDALKQLADFVIEQYYPELIEVANDVKYLQLLYAITRRTARLVAQWQASGFVHSVMNTDNMSVIGLTMDLGVYGFMEKFNPGYSPNINDDQERYAFNQQVEVARWNCLVLAESLLELLPGKKVPAALLREFNTTQSRTYLGLMRKKLGISSEHKDDILLVKQLLGLLEKCNKDYSRFFQQLTNGHPEKQFHLFNEDPQWNDQINQWLALYHQRLQLEFSSLPEQQLLMQQHNPGYLLRKQQLAKAIKQAEENADFTLLKRLATVLQAPFEKHPGYSDLA